MEETIAQWISIAGLACVVASYQQKKKSALILVQATGGALFAIHYLILGAYAGFLLNTIALIRGIIFYKEFRTPKTGKIWVGVIIVLCLLAYVLTFTVFGTTPSLTNLILELLPTIGRVVLTISFNMTHAGHIRALGSINSAGWLTYNIAHLSIGGIACEVLCIISIIVGILRHDIKKK